ncbi:WG repeat-containing protein [Alkaliphilus pronyensis]|uniref:WG repeat-containing protein n=1 Tax=Alkaliphilus pronyensis TaxID=1482732 RepID=UPI00186575D9|nr:WG repeat-containing protein [Alkaliphilus pronyensis]
MKFKYGKLLVVTVMIFVVWMIYKASLDEYIYEDASVFFDDGIAIIQIDGLYGCIDINGEILLAPQFEDIHYASKNYIQIKKMDIMGL